MTSKIKLNAAEVVKNMTEKELRKYKITLEKEGKSSSISAPAWFKEFYAEYKQFYVEFKTFEKEMLEFKAKQEQFNKMIVNRLDNIVKKNNLKE